MDIMDLKAILILKIRSHIDHVAFTSVVVATTKTTTVTTRIADYQAHAHHQKTNSTQKKSVSCDDKKEPHRRATSKITSIMFI